MAINNSYYPYTMPAAGASVALDVTDPSNTYLITATGGSIVLAAAMTFTASGSPLIGTEFKILYGGGVTSDTASGKTVSFFGTSLTDAQAAQELTITAVYSGFTNQFISSYSSISS